MTPERYRRIRQVLATRFADLTVLMEQVHKPHNLSAIVRTCDAVGVPRVHAVAAQGMRIHHHTSSGSGRWVAVETHPHVTAAAQELRTRGFRIVVAHPSPESTPLWQVDFRAPTALMVGAELHGISDTALALADQCIAVPMAGMVGSLNVSVAVAVTLYEALRQRSGDPRYRPPRLSQEEQERLAVEWSYPRLAALHRARGLPYPALDEDGYLIPQGRRL